MENQELLLAKLDQVLVDDPSVFIGGCHPESTNLNNAKTCLLSLSQQFYDYVISNNPKSVIKRIEIETGNEEMIWQQINLLNGNLFEWAERRLHAFDKSRSLLRIVESVQKTESGQDESNEERLSSDSDFVTASEGQTPKTKGRVQGLEQNAHYNHVNENNSNSSSENESLNNGEEEDQRNSLFGESDDEPEQEIYYKDFFGKQAPKTDFAMLEESEMKNEEYEEEESENDDFNDEEFEGNQGNSNSDGEYDSENIEQDGFENSSNEIESEQSEDDLEKPLQLFDASEDVKNQYKSSFEKQQETLKLQIEAIENEMVDAKPWLMIGEVSAKQRPIDSLLEHDLDFEVVSKNPPVITQEVTNTIESLIKKRILEKMWDDVQKKDRESTQVTKTVVANLSTEKSQVSLSDAYAADLQKNARGESGNVVDEKLQKEHDEINLLCQSLFTKLDALSNFHFTPKPISSEIKIISSMPSLNMEEALPSIETGDVGNVQVSATEVFKGEQLLSRSEMTQEQKHSAHLKKKRSQQKSAIKKKVPEKEKTIQKLKNMRNVTILSKNKK